MRTAPESLRDLPAPIQDLIVTVVRRTGLWRGEKRDVLAELRAHFVDGLAELEQEGIPADRAAPMLIERFGDPRQAARLIRRGKKRARPLLWKAWVSSVGAVGLCVLALLLYVGWIYTGKPTPSVDYVAKLQRSVESIPESDRSWPLIRQVCFQLPSVPKAFEGMEKGIGELKPDDPQWPAALAWARAGQSQLDTLHQAAQRRACGWTYDPIEGQRLEFEVRRLKGEIEPDAEFKPAHQTNDGPPLMSVNMSHLSWYRQMAKFLVVTALVRSANGDVDGAMTALDDAHRLGDQFLPDGYLIEHLVGLSMIKPAMQATFQILHNHRDSLKANQLQQFRSMPLVVAPAEQFSINLRREREFFYDVLQYTFTDDGQGDGHVLPRELEQLLGRVIPQSEYPFIAFHAGRKATIEKFDELWKGVDERLQSPLYDSQRSQVDEAIKRLMESDIDRVRYALLVQFTPSFSRADRMMREAAMVQTALHTSVAILAWRAEKSQYPAQLSDLVPTHLPKLPEDAYSGRPLKYARRGEDFTLYSIGPNLKDDGGDGVRVIRSAEIPPDRRDSVFSGQPVDIVYWPPTEPQPETQEASDESVVMQRRLAASNPESAASQPATATTSAPVPR